MSPTIFEQERDRDAERIRQELAALVRTCGITQRRIEQLNGFKRGYVSQVLQGHITLSMRHVLGILMAVEMPPMDFFAKLFNDGSREPDSALPLDEIRERLARYDAALDELQDKGLIGDQQNKSYDSGDRR